MTKDDAYQAGYDAAFLGHPRMYSTSPIGYDAEEQWQNGWDDAKTDKTLMTLDEQRFAGYKAYQRYEARLKTKVEGILDG